MERFPDQSQVNLFLNRMTAENLAQLEHAHQELLHSHSLLRSAERVVMDFDQIRLRVTGKRFEFAEKGYFPRRRGARGYQLSAALASAEGYEPEAITERWRSARTNGVRAATPDVCDITRELGSRNCAEFKACHDLLLSGSQLVNIVYSRTRTGEVFPPCVNCIVSLGPARFFGGR